MTARSLALTLVALAALALLAGCVRRTLSLTSEPAGALLTLNGREIGRTPVNVEFLSYGDYDVELTKDGYEPLLTHGMAEPPWWDGIPIDLFAELTNAHSRIAWHYQLEPESDDRAALVERATGLRVRVETELPAPLPEMEPRMNADERR